jgi:hypothetical protein
VDAATIYAADLAAVAIGITLLSGMRAWWAGGGRPAARAGAPQQVAAAADRLADEVSRRWRREAVARRITTPAPVTVRWHWAIADSPAPSSELTAPGPEGAGPRRLPRTRDQEGLLESGVVSRLHDEMYARLPHGRLVLTGESGAGKTGAMMLLLLAALSHRASLPVPVWLTLGGWEPEKTPLLVWAAQTMTRDHPALRAADYGPDAAGELLLGDRVALFFDGLDEMPAASRSQALKRIDEEARGLRVVITTRPGEYRDAARGAVLSNTAVIELRPVRPRAAAAYLRQGHAGLNRERWERVADYLERNPGSVAARALDNPLALSLARDSYSARDPSELADPDRFSSVEELRMHLIDQFIITAYPDEAERRRAVRWLSWLAHKMGPSRELAWWEIPEWVTRWQFYLARDVTGLLVAGSVAAFAAEHLIGLAGGQARGTVTAVAAGLVVGGAAVAVGEYGVRFRRQPTTLLPRFPGLRELWWIIQVGLAGALTCGLINAVATSLAAELVSGAGDRAARGLIVGLVTGSTFGLVIGLAIGLCGVWLEPIASSPSASAIGSYRADLRTCTLGGLMTGIAGGVVAGFGAGLKFGPAFGLEAAVVFGLGSGLAVLIAVSRAPLVTLAQFLLVVQGKGLVRFMRLLEDAASRQVLRQAGTVYQFRHAELQERLNTAQANAPKTDNRR